MGPYKVQKEVKSTQKRLNVKVLKVVKSKVMMLMLINFNNAQSPWLFKAAPFFHSLAVFVQIFIFSYVTNERTLREGPLQSIQLLKKTRMISIKYREVITQL